MNITSKGQVTIPQHIRQTYHLEPNTEVEFIEEDGKVWLRPAKSPTHQTRFGRFRGTATTAMSTEQILALTRDDMVAERSNEYKA